MVQCTIDSYSTCGSKTVEKKRKQSVTFRLQYLAHSVKTLSKRRPWWPCGLLTVIKRTFGRLRSPWPYSANSDRKRRLNDSRNHYVEQHKSDASAFICRNNSSCSSDNACGSAVLLCSCADNVTETWYIRTQCLDDSGVTRRGAAILLLTASYVSALSGTVSTRTLLKHHLWAVLKTVCHSTSRLGVLHDGVISN